MASPRRPASESFQSVRYSGSHSLSFSSEAGIVGLEEEDRAPIFSLSKSSMDVVMPTGTLHKRTRADLRRSSSTNTHCEQNSVTLQQLHPHMWQHINSTNSHQLSLTAHNVDVHSPPALSERWIANMHRWSGYSGSTHSRSSTPDTVVWKDGTLRPLSLTQETLYSAAPDSPMSRQTSPPATPSPFISPLQTPTLPPEDLLSSSSILTLSAHQQKDIPSPSLLPSPLRANSSSPLPPNSAELLQLTSTEDEGFLENNSLSFTFPSPIPSSVSLAEAGGSSDPECHVDDAIEELHSPEGTPQVSEGGENSPLQMFSSLMPNSPAGRQESGREVSVCHLELPGQSCPPSRVWRSPLVASLSDSQLGGCCRCHLNTRDGFTKAPKVEVFKEEATMTSLPELVDAAVQTISPIGSLWGLKRNTSTSNMGSHSILGSPPGSRLNLKSSVGSNSNLVSPSSSMFPVSSGEEEVEKQGDDPTWDVNSACSRDLERKRSCLKTQGEENELGRRSSMKQVQWDEDGMTWDVHGASVDPEVLSTAIQKHLDIQNSPKPAKRSSKKKKAPKPPLIANVVKAMTPEFNPPVIITSTCRVEGESEGAPEAGGGSEVEAEGGSKKEEPVEAARRISRAEAEYAKEEDEVYREEGTSQSPSRGSGHKKSVIRSLRRPRWCGSSRKTCD